MFRERYFRVFEAVRYLVLILTGKYLATTSNRIRGLTHRATEEQFVGR
jgi:hypothetical protein